MKVFNKTILIVLTLIVLTLTACKSEESKKVEQAKNEFKVLYTYDEDRIRPVLEDEKTPEELAEDYLLERIGMDEENPSFKERGVLRDQGIFIESAIYDGSKIPNISAMSEDTIKRLENNREDRSLEKKKKEFKRLEKERKKVLEKQYEEDKMGKEEIEEDIKEKAAEIELEDEEELYDEDDLPKSDKGREGEEEFEEDDNEEDNLEEEGEVEFEEEIEYENEE